MTAQFGRAVHVLEKSSGMPRAGTRTMSRMDASWLPRYFGIGGCPANPNRSNGQLKSTGRTMPKDALTLLLAAPRGFCAGVDRAIQIVERALERYGAPVYVRH